MLESLVFSCDSPMTPTPSPTSLPSVSISCVIPSQHFHLPGLSSNTWSENPNNRARWQDRQASDCMWHPSRRLRPPNQMLTCSQVGYRRSGAFPNHHLFLLPWCPRHLRRLRCYRHGLIQQRQAMAPGN